MGLVGFQDPKFIEMLLSDHCHRMQASESVSVASTDAPVVSPPHPAIRECFVSNRFMPPFKSSVLTSPRASECTRNVTDDTSVARRAETLPDTQERPQMDEQTTSERTEGTTTRETAGTDLSRREDKATQKSDSRVEQDRGASDSKPKRIQPDEKKEAITDKRWFDLLPVVLANLKTYNREHVNQLSVPRCAKCERVRAERKAVIRCKQNDCVVVDRPLCLICWESYHESLEARQHRGQHASACPQCQLDWIVYWCAECDLKFCKKCFEQIHSVSATTSHRKIATEDAPGTCFVTSHWSASFQNVIVHMIASQKQKINSKTDGSTRGAKRKRDVEVIVIDDDEEENDKEGMSQQNESSTGKEDGFMRSSGANSQLQQNASGNTNHQISTNDQSMLGLLPIPQESAPIAPLSHQTGSAYSTSSTLNDANTVNIGTGGASLQCNANMFQLGASSQMRNRGITASATSVTGNGTMHVTQSSVPTIVNTTNESWSTSSATSTNLANTFRSNNQLPLGGAASAENAPSDSLMDRYHEVSQNIAKMELQTEELNRQIAIQTCQELYRVGPVTTLLMNLQSALEAAKKQRDQLFVAIIIQSKTIMTSVRRLRLVDLGDVPEISIIGHRTCLQLTNEIDCHQKSLATLYRLFSEAVNRSALVNFSWEDLHIRAISANIQMYKKNIEKLQKVRDMKFVQIVQFSHNVREALKQEFQRQHLQQLQRHQSQL